MLQELAIQNFAIISSLRVNFDEGMTVLTGETGAGKSIIIDAMGLLVGGRGSTMYIRQGASKCTIEGLFSIPEKHQLYPILEDLAIEIEDGMLVLQREIFRNGKNSCRVNGTLVNTITLRRIGESLVDIHGQNEHQELMQSDRHLDLLDEFGDQQLATIKNDYLTSYHDFRELERKITNRQKNEKEFAQRMDMLQFQSDEIDSAQLVIGEEERLIEERKKLSNFQKIAEALAVSYEALQGENSQTLDQVGTAMNSMLEIEEIDEEYQQISETIKSSYFSLQEVTSDLSRHLDALEMDENRLDEVEMRLDTIRLLKRKYGDSVEVVLNYFQEISKELAEASFYDGKNDKLEEMLKLERRKVEKIGRALSLERHKVASFLEQEILKQLKELYMDKTQFEVRFKALADEAPILTENGLDEIEFFITTNPGEPLRPLVKVASGGELSRIMLALKTIFSQTQGITSIVFDEVDTGVSGRVAQAIANKIHQVATNSQVLCITHLPQVAAVADAQYFIKKEIVGDRTETSLEHLTAESRVNEIARMLAGSEITSLTIAHAKELLKMAQDNQKSSV